MEYTRSIKLDINPSGLPPVIRIKQGDGSARFIEITLLKDNVAWTPESGVVFYFRCEKPDGTALMTDSTTIDPTLNRKLINVSGGTITVELVAQADAVSGRCKCDLCLTKNEQVLSTIPFVLDVVASPNTANRIASTDEFAALVEALDKASHVETDVQDVIDAATAAATNANNKATAANNAASAANTAAGRLENMDAAASAVSPGGSPTATVTTVGSGSSSHYRISLGVPAGATGVGISTTETKYGVSASQSTLPSTWVSDATSLDVEGDEWLWVRNTMNFSDNREPVVTYMKSQRGMTAPDIIAVQDTEPQDEAIKMWVNPEGDGDTVSIGDVAGYDILPWSNGGTGCTSFDQVMYSITSYKFNSTKGVAGYDILNLTAGGSTVLRLHKSKPYFGLLFISHGVNSTGSAVDSTPSLYVITSPGSGTADAPVVEKIGWNGSDNINISVTAGTGTYADYGIITISSTSSYARKVAVMPFLI